MPQAPKILDFAPPPNPKPQIYMKFIKRPKRTQRPQGPQTPKRPQRLQKRLWSKT